MGTEFDHASSSNSGNDTPYAWIQSALSDLEESTKSMVSLIKPENVNSSDACAEIYYDKKSELERQIKQFEKLYHLLLDQYSPILTRFSVSSISTLNQLENTSDLNPQSLDPDSQSQNGKITEISQKTLEEYSSISERHYESFSFHRSSLPLRNESSDSEIELCVSDVDPEILEKNISKLSETSQKRSGKDVFERWIDFEKRISTSEVILELVEDNKTHMDELLRRYEEQSRLNNRFKEQIEVMMRENQLLHDENLKLMSENKTLVTTIQDRIKEERSSKFCSSCCGTRVVKCSVSWLKTLIQGPCK